MSKQRRPTSTSFLKGAAKATPVFVTKSAPYNFLREYWLGCEQGQSTAQEILLEASQAWKALAPHERKLFEEPEYLRARFGHLIHSVSASGLVVDLLTAQTAVIENAATSKQKDLGNEQASAFISGSPSNKQAPVASGSSKTKEPAVLKPRVVASRKRSRNLCQVCRAKLHGTKQKRIAKHSRTVSKRIMKGYKASNDLR
ncbi:uncharacterized protein LOC115633076 [Scaptodrosophila lebanonensis]|uniref:Uncharacterized protein LOC115633076 n=1 Tax=Drosophila lebanonensis TaxID=7225 RepID=A0A6J2UDT5_DROLE|nr:uncharacterized protein LOC115633076 [Scaptodrosophila lebanonensis]